MLDVPISLIFSTVFLLDVKRLTAMLILPVLTPVAGHLHSMSEFFRVFVNRSVEIVECLQYVPDRPLHEDESLLVAMIVRPCVISSH